MPFERISILGVGLLGGSVALAARKNINDVHIIGYGHRQTTLDRALELNAIDEATQDLAKAVKDADLVLLCTPVGLFEGLLEGIRESLRAEAVVSDVGSTKRSVGAQAGKLLPDSVHFVGSHPMAGSEKRGIEHARADLVADAPCIVTPTPETDPAAVERVVEFWTLLGMHVHQLSPEQHDQAVATMSHMPHLLAALLVAEQDDTAMNLAGKGFRDATRIAAGDPALWRDIAADNADLIAGALERMSRSIQTLRQHLLAGNYDAVFQMLQTSAQRRSEMPPGCGKH